MSLRELPDIQDTRTGKELIAIGEKRGELLGEKRGEFRGELRGERNGELKAILLQLAAKFGPLEQSLRERIQAIQSIEVLDQILVQIVTIEALDELKLE